jgi:hypothetical protein
MLMSERSGAMRPREGLAHLVEWATKDTTYKLSTGREYAQALRAVKPEDLGRPVAVVGAGFGFGTFPLAQAAALPVVEILHHRGQISYVQALLGDTDVHVESWT